MGRIAVAYNDDADLKPYLNEFERFGDEEVIDCASEAAETLGAEMVPVRHDVGGALRKLRDFDVVIDFCEGVLGNPRFEKSFALALEMIGIAHTSCDPIAVALCTDKILVKRLLQAAGLPTPRGYASPSEAPPGTYIVKPSLATLVSLPPNGWWGGRRNGQTDRPRIWRRRIRRRLASMSRPVARSSVSL